LPPDVDDGTELYKGSCHCGAITYAARLVALGKVQLVDPQGDLPSYGVLPVPAMKESGFRGATMIPFGVYKLGDGEQTVKFCPKCGVTVVVLGTKGVPADHLLVNLRTLDVEGWEAKLGK